MIVYFCRHANFSSLFNVLNKVSPMRHAAKHLPHFQRFGTKRGFAGRVGGGNLWLLLMFLVLVVIGGYWVVDTAALFEAEHATAKPPFQLSLAQRGIIDDRRPDLSSSSSTSSSSTTAGDIESIRWRFEEYAPASSDGASLRPLHNFTQQLPVGAKKFCTAHPEDTTMEVMEPYMAPNDPLEIPNRTVWVDGCTEPVMILPFQGVLMYPQLKCGSLKPWRTFAVRRVGHSKSTAVPTLTKEVGVSSEPPASIVKSCLNRCLDSPCCLTFGVVRNVTALDDHFTCTLYLCDYTRAHHQRLPVEKFPGYSYVLAHRREYRPSLVSNAWRIAVHRGPGRVIRLHGPNETWAGVIRRGAPLPLPPMVVRGRGDVADEAQESSLFDIRAVAEHGTLMQPVNGVAEIRVRCYGHVVPMTETGKPNVTAPFFPFARNRIDERSTASTSLVDVPTFDVTSSVRIDQGRAVSDGAWMPVSDVWEKCVGRWLQVDMNASIWRIHPAEELKVPFSGPVPDIMSLSTTLVSIVHHLGNGGARLGWTPPLPAPTSRFGEVTLPPNLFSTSLTECAAHLFPNECCVRFVHAFQIPRINGSGSQQLPQHMGGASHPELEHTFLALSIVTEIEGQVQSLNCVTLVDGFTSHFDEDGVARFPNLVVRVHREDPACVHPTAVIRFQGKQRFQRSAVNASFWEGDAGVALPVGWFLGHCGNSKTADLTSNNKKKVATTTLVSSEVNPAAPILISVPAHECIECLHSFLSNIRAFVWPSIVVVHFPSTIATMPSDQELRLLNRSHPRTFVNTYHVDSVVGVRLLHIHGINIHFALTHLVHLGRFSHALLLASNELFVKPGVVEYIRQYDAVWMHNPTADTGALYEHHGDGRHHWTPQEFHPMEEMLRYKPRQWGFVWPDAIVADHWLAAAMRRRNITQYPMNTVLLEGTFFRHDIAAEFAKEMMEMFDPFDYCEDPMIYPHCEILGPTVLQNICERPGVRCGHRVTTMLWHHHDWTSTVEDVRRVRCSPFQLPFGFKRIPRSMDNPVRLAIARLTTAALVAAGNGGEAPTLQTRDRNATYCNAA